MHAPRLPLITFTLVAVGVCPAQVTTPITTLVPTITVVPSPGSNVVITPQLPVTPAAPPTLIAPAQPPIPVPANTPSVPAHLTNVSIRARAGSGPATLIAGAVVQGPGNLPMLVRAIGPGLTRFGLKNALPDPRLEVYRGDTLTLQTSSVGPGVAAASATVGAFPALETTSGFAAGDAALVGSASAGMFTAHCSSAGNASGVALLEFYDTASAPSEGSPRFVNFSSRAQVETGEGIIVVGFVIAGQGNVRLLLRGVGPSLDQFGITGTLSDPLIELYSGTTRIASNDNWRSSDPYVTSQLELAHFASGAFGLTNEADAAMVVTLGAGSYTLQVRGAAGQSGVALAEIHEVNASEFDPAQAMNAVGLDLYRELLTNPPGDNVIVSPYSIESALALAYAGTDGDTRTEMARALRLPADDGPLQAGFAGLRHALQNAAQDSIPIAAARTQGGKQTNAIEWNEANRLFGEQTYVFRDAFLSLMRDGFEAPFQPVDFIQHAEDGRLTINHWVEDQTHDKIKDLIPKDGVDACTRLVLVNALYLKAAWDVPFEKSDTRPQPFHLTPETTRDVVTMNRHGVMGYTVEDGITVVTLDYLGLGLQFVVMLPNEGTSVDAAAARLTPDHFARWAKLRDASRRDVILYIPKFKAEGATISLNDALQAIGVKHAFDLPEGTANFNRMAPPKPDEYLKITGVFHQTFVAIDEESTEAAAATAVVIGSVATSATIGPQPLVVRVDRPFLFAIQHRASGACLFLGRVKNPQS